MTDNDWKEEPYVKDGFRKLENTQKNNRQQFPKWLAFICMTPTEQIQKRFKDLQSMNRKTEDFLKFIEFKNALIAQNYRA